jgi:hypothetical protein
VVEGGGKGDVEIGVVFIGGVAGEVEITDNESGRGEDRT